VQVVETEGGRVRMTVAMSERPHEVEVSPDGRFAFVPIYGDSGVGRPGTDGRSIEVLDLRSGAVEPLPLDRAVRPHDARFGPDGLLYVTAELADAVFVVDPAARRVVGEIPTGRPQSHSLVISPDGRRGYTANVSTGSVSVLDLKQRRLLGVVEAGEMVQRVSVSPDGKRVFTHNQRRPRVIAIDPARLAVAETYDLPGLAYASAATPDGRTLLIAGRPEREGAVPRQPSMYVLDLRTRGVATITLPGWPRNIIIDPRGELAWANLGSGQLVSIDIKRRTARTIVTLDRGLDGMALRPSVQPTAASRR
jgi:DNA-binding beta-propeller fold protein YncE